MTPLKEKLLGLIRETGPITLSQYMQMALLDPVCGYYVTRDPLGRDFITAPEISQIFGELIGLFFVQAWEDRGKPDRFHLVEVGPGRGTLMADMLRASRIRPAFAAAAEICLIEISPALQAVQAATLGDARVVWRRDFREVPDDAPLFLVANEFFDALPVRQFIRTQRGWHERMVGAEGDGLVFAAAPDPAPNETIPAALRDAPAGSVFEVSPASHSVAREIAGRIAQHGGVALIVDYGHERTAIGDTFQAVKAQRYADPLAEPGEADLTFHVDFATLAHAARDAGAQTSIIVTQAQFLTALGIGLRAERLKRESPENAESIDAAIDRLTNLTQMGSLFKVLALSAPHTPPLPGFPC